MSSAQQTVCGFTCNRTIEFGCALTKWHQYITLHAEAHIEIDGCQGPITHYQQLQSTKAFLLLFNGSQ